MSLLEYLGLRPTLPRFASRLLRAIPNGSEGEWSFDSGRCSLRHSGGSEITLHNMFLEYCASKASERSNLIQKYAALSESHLNEVPDLWIEAAKNIYPVVRSEFVESSIEIRCRSEDASYDPVVLPMVGDVRIRLMYDFGSYLSYVRGDKLRTWGQSPQSVLERAIPNLGSLQTPSWVDSRRGFFQIASPQSFGESLLLLDSVVRGLPFAEHAVLMPCARGVLLAADGRSVESLGAMLEEAERCLQEDPWPISSVMCRRSEEGWEEFPAPEQLANLAHGLSIRHLAEHYAAQKDALDAMNEVSGEDICVAEFSVIRSDEEWQSYCVWSEGIRTMLPAADSIAIVPGGESSDHVRVLWRDVVAICGSRLLQTSESPARFRVESFPDSREWEELKSRAIAG